jgi:hypothetical protein
VDAVRNLAAHYRRSPGELREEEVRAYLLSLREWGVALGTFKTNHDGIQFLYRRTLDRDWPLFGKKDPSSQDLPFRYVCLSAHKRGRNAGSQRDRQRQYAAARHWQGQQAAAGAAATACSERSARPLVNPPSPALVIPQSRRHRTSQHARSGLYLPKRARRRWHQATGAAARSAPQLCDPSAGKWC